MSYTFEHKDKLVYEALTNPEEHQKWISEINRRVLEESENDVEFQDMLDKIFKRGKYAKQPAQ